VHLLINDFHDPIAGNVVNYASRAHSKEGFMETLHYESRRPAVPRRLPIRVPWMTIFVGTAIVVGLGLFFLPGAPRAQCGSNEYQIVVGLYDYAQRNGGALPPSLMVLQQTNSNFSKIIACPAGPGAYVYVGQTVNLKTAPHGTILLYEPPTNHKDRKSGKGLMHVGYADGSIQQVVQPQADKIIAELNAGHNPPRAEMIR
jgi:hypothetical protein